jgi:hypothetical protein
LLQRRCNITAIDAALRRACNDRMMEGAHTPGSSPAFGTRRPPAAPGEAAGNSETPENTENRENTENGKTLKTVRTAGTLPDAPAALPGETLKQDTPASHGGAEAVQHAPTRPGGPIPRRAGETLKQVQETQASKGVSCFMPILPAGPAETAPRRNGTAREALKHLAGPFSGAGRMKP